ncbi:MAG: hypothetical protein HY751_12550 [Nitrospinae bacterium]|nr:hypothetical protein [Nitrospinota bacterium]
MRNHAPQSAGNQPVEEGGEHKAAPEEAKAPEHEAAEPEKPAATPNSIQRVSDDTDWKLDKPIEMMKMEDPKDLDKARRRVLRDMRMTRKEAVKDLKDADKEEQAKKERAAAIAVWLEKDDHQDVVK